MNNKINGASKSIAISNKNILENNHYMVIYNSVFLWLYISL